MKRLLPLALLLGACAMSPQMQSKSPRATPAGTTGATGTRHDIEALEARIAVERAAAQLGPGVGAGAREPAPAGGSAPAIAPVVSPGTASGEEEAAPPPVPAASPSGSDRCRRVGAATVAICDAAARICRIARELAEEPADRSCRRAESDCNDARHASALCAG